MNEDMQNRIAEAFCCSDEITDAASARQALASGKSNRRFISWNLILGVLSDNPKKWPSEALMRYNWYWTIIKDVFSECPNWGEISDKDYPLATDIKLLEGQQMIDIHIDVIRTCSTMIKQYSPRKVNSDEIHRRIERILYIISFYTSEMGYAQGFDRFAIILYFMCQNYFEEFGLGSDFAEAFGYTMTYRFLLLVRFHKFIGSEDSLTKWIAGYQNILEVNQPKIATDLTRLGVSPTQYVFSWLALLFADLHSQEDLFLIWDRCLIYSDSFHTYAFCLAVAHVAQVFYGGCDEKQLPELLHKFRSWDIGKLLSDAELYFAHTRHEVHQNHCCSWMSKLMA